MQIEFNPNWETCDAEKWKPNAKLANLAIRRCDWINSKEINEIQPPEEWLRVIVVGAYYQGLADGVKHMARKARLEGK